MFVWAQLIAIKNQERPSQLVRQRFDSLVDLDSKTVTITLLTPGGINFANKLTNCSCALPII